MERRNEETERATGSQNEECIVILAFEHSANEVKRSFDRHVSQSLTLFKNAIEILTEDQAKRLDVSSSLLSAERHFLELKEDILRKITKSSENMQDEIQAAISATAKRFVSDVELYLSNLTLDACRIKKSSNADVDVNPSKRARIDATSIQDISASRNILPECSHNCQGWSKLSEVSITVPSLPGVYEVKAERASKSVYISSSSDLRYRLMLHKMKAPTGKPLLDEYINRNYDKIVIKYKVLRSFCDAMDNERLSLNTFFDENQHAPTYN